MDKRSADDCGPGLLLACGGSCSFVRRESVALAPEGEVEVSALGVGAAPLALRQPSSERLEETVVDVGGLEAFCARLGEVACQAAERGGVGERLDLRAIALDGGQTM